MASGRGRNGVSLVSQDRRNSTGEAFANTCRMVVGEGAEGKGEPHAAHLVPL